MSIFPGAFQPTTTRFDEVGPGGYSVLERLFILRSVDGRIASKMKEKPVAVGCFWRDIAMAKKY
jgi:hypothetical protein